MKERNPLPPSGLKSKISPDEAALFLYLKRFRDSTSSKVVYEHFFACLGGHFSRQGVNDANCGQIASVTFGHFLSAIELGDIKGALKVPLWTLFLAFGRAGYPQYDWAVPPQPQTTYLAKSCLISLLKIETVFDGVMNAIAIAFENPSKEDFEFTNLGRCSTFEDVYQNAIMSLMNSPPKQEEKHSARFYQYFRTLLLRRAIDICNKKINSPEVTMAELPTDEIIELPEMPENEEICHNSSELLDYIVEYYGLNEIFATENNSEALQSMINLLEIGCQQIIRLFYFKGCSYREIAKKMKIEEGSVGTTKARCLKKLRSAFDQLKKKDNG